MSTIKSNEKTVVKNQPSFAKREKSHPNLTFLVGNLPQFNPESVFEKNTNIAIAIYTYTFAKILEPPS